MHKDPGKHAGPGLRAPGCESLSRDVTLLVGAVGPWTFGWEALVALGTLGLAFATWRLASATKRTAVETQKLAGETTKLAGSTDREVKALGDPEGARRGGDASV